jgi:hypothetical protein
MQHMRLCKRPKTNANEDRERSEEMTRKECPRCAFELTVIPDQVSRKCNRCMWIGCLVSDLAEHFAEEKRKEKHDEH